MEQTLFIIKPDAVKRQIEFRILQRLVDAGLAIPHLRKMILSDRHIDVICASQAKDPEIFSRLQFFYKSSPSIVGVAFGHDAIRKVMSMRGTTACAAPGTIRGDFSHDPIVACTNENRALNNVFHCSDSSDSADLELRTFIHDILVKPDERSRQ